MKRSIVISGFRYLAPSFPVLGAEICENENVHAHSSVPARADVRVDACADARAGAHTTTFPRQQLLVLSS